MVSTWTPRTIIKQVNKNWWQVTKQVYGQDIRFNMVSILTLRISHVDIKTEAHIHFLGAHSTKNRDLRYYTHRATVIILQQQEILEKLIVNTN